jgi:hypothetical protein
MSGQKEVDAPDPKIYGFNPISHHYVKKSGPVWLRLAKAGIVQDPELLGGIQEKALVRKQAAEKKSAAKAEAKEAKELASKTAAVKKAPSAAAKTKALRAARKLVASNRSELDDLESDAVHEKLSKVMAKRLALGDATTTDAPSSDSDSDPVKQPAKPSSRIRLKSQPIPIPITKKTGSEASDRRAALRKTLSEIYSDED